MATNRINNYSFEDFDRPEDKQKSRIGAGIFGVIVLIILFAPWYETIYPIPEAEGLMASFGDVQIAGGDAPPPVKQEIVKPLKEEVEVVKDKEAPVIEDVKEKVKETPKVEPTPTPNPNPNSLFNKSGTGTGNGDGKQGTPDGKDDLGGTGGGDNGNGNGVLGARRQVKKCDDYQKGSASWQEKGKAVIRICVNASGDVIDAKIDRKKSTITSQTLIDLVVGCAQHYKYERAPGTPNSCGDITINLGVN